MQEILKYLRSSGERLDADIAKAMGLSITSARSRLSVLAAQGEIVMCQATRFEGRKKIEGWLCRVSGYVPPAAPGRKPGVNRPHSG